MIALDLSPHLEEFRKEARRGLTAQVKRMSPKFLYDQRGSELFEKICRVMEYYPTRTETAILREYAGRIAEAVGEKCFLLEFGSGASTKTRILLDTLPELEAYAPIDISRSFLSQTAEELSALHPGLRIAPICADFTQPLEVPRELLGEARRKLAFFPGSTIGNFDPAEAQRFLTRTARMLGRDGMFLLGFDLLKDRKVLEAAYNDSEGVTRDFNLNLLVRMNEELGANFDLSAFEHHAFFNPELSRIEMHIRSRVDGVYQVGDFQVRFARNETIHTENSYKYSIERMLELAGAAGFEPSALWTDPERKFCVALFRVVLDA